MHINADEIIQKSKDVFLADTETSNRYFNSPCVSEIEYNAIHKDFLTPLNITFSPSDIFNYVMTYRQFFQRWGETDQERYGIALVNKDGNLRYNDPVNMSLQEWNIKNPQNKILEIDCTVKTELLSSICFQPFNIFHDHWCRSNVLIWKKDAHFLPHIDAIKPTPWLRLWGCTGKNVSLRYEVDNELVEVKGIDPGRLYLIDTTRVHDARNLNDTSMQLFLSVLPSAYNIIKSSLL